MTSQQFFLYVAEAADVQAALKKHIERAREKQHSISFLAVAPQHYVHEKQLGALVKNALAESNSRHGADWIVRQADNYCFYVVLGADLEYTVDRACDVQKACGAQNMRIAGSVMYLPRGGSVDEQAREVYECLSNGIADHRRKLPFVYPKDVTQPSNSARPASSREPSPVA